MIFGNIYKLCNLAHKNIDLFFSCRFHMWTVLTISWLISLKMALYDLILFISIDFVLHVPHMVKLEGCFLSLWLCYRSAFLLTMVALRMISSSQLMKLSSHRLISHACFRCNILVGSLMIVFWSLVRECSLSLDLKRERT